MSDPEGTLGACGGVEGGVIYIYIYMFVYARASESIKLYKQAISDPTGTRLRLYCPRGRRSGGGGAI